MTTRPPNFLTGRAGEHYVAAELCKRGTYAVAFMGNMPEVDIVASNLDRTHTAYIQVKTRKAQRTKKKRKVVGNWYTKSGEGCKEPKENAFWVFVSLPPDAEEPVRYFIIPDKWMRDDIKGEHVRHEEHWKKNNPGKDISLRSDMHIVGLHRIDEWEGRWDLLCLGLAAEAKVC